MKGFAVATLALVAPQVVTANDNGLALTCVLVYCASRRCLCAVSTRCPATSTHLLA